MTKRIDSIDITDKIGQLYSLRGSRAHPRHPLPEWPMYSYERPASILWNALANALHQRGWTEGEIRDWLQSKYARWALDGYLGEAILQIAESYADYHIKDHERRIAEQARKEVVNRE